MSTNTVRIGERAVKTTVINTQAQLDQSLKRLLSTIIKSTMRRVVGFDIEKDCEFETGSNRIIEKVAIVKLCHGTNVLIIQLCNMNGPPRSLSKFLQLPELSFVSVGMKHCLEALERDYGIKCRNAVDLGQLGASLREKELYKVYGLLDLAERECLMEVDVNKLPSTYSAAALSSWGATFLSKEQVDAASWSAFLCFCIGNRFFGKHMPSSATVDYVKYC